MGKAKMMRASFRTLERASCCIKGKLEDRRDQRQEVNTDIFIDSMRVVVLTMINKSLKVD